jgi:hypothetical protein
MPTEIHASYSIILAVLPLNVHPRVLTITHSNSIIVYDSTSQLQVQAHIMPPRPSHCVATPSAGVTIEQALADAEKTYVSSNTKSATAHFQAEEFMPGGNTRSVLYNRPFPLCISSGRMNNLWDVDGHK